MLLVRLRYELAKVDRASGGGERSGAQPGCRGTCGTPPTGGGLCDKTALSGRLGFRSGIRTDFVGAWVAASTCAAALGPMGRPASGVREAMGHTHSAMSVGEAARLLGRDRTRIYALLRSGDLVAAPTSAEHDLDGPGPLRIDRASLDRWQSLAGGSGGPLAALDLLDYPIRRPSAWVEGCSRRSPRWRRRCSAHRHPRSGGDLVGVLWASASQGLRVKELRAAIGLSRERLESPRTSFCSWIPHLDCLSSVTATSCAWSVRPEVAKSIERHLGNPRPVALSRAALEVLAIVACEQPMARAGVELIRGSASDSALDTLLSVD